MITRSIPITRCPACFQGVALTHDNSHCHLCKQELQKRAEDVSRRESESVPCAVASRISSDSSTT